MGRASSSSVCVVHVHCGSLKSSVGSERQEASVCFGQVRYGDIQYRHRASPNTAGADQSVSPASHCVSRWQSKRSLYCFAMQKDRLHPVVSQPALVSCRPSGLSAIVGTSQRRLHFPKPSPSGFALCASNRAVLRFCECVAKGELKAWQTEVRTQHCTKIASGGNLVCNV